MNNQKTVPNPTTNKAIHPAIKISERTEAPLQAICLVKGECPRVPQDIGSNPHTKAISLCCIDMDSRIYTELGVFERLVDIPGLKEVALNLKGEHEDCCDSYSIQGIYVSPEKAASLVLPDKMEGCPDFSIDVWFDSNKHHIPPYLKGFSKIHPYLGEYLHGSCIFYAEALLATSGGVGLWVEKESYSHAVVLHPGDLVEDIWGVRPLHSYLRIVNEKEFGIEDAQVSKEKFDTCSRMQKENIGLLRFINMMSKAAKVAISNPRSSIFNPAIFSGGNTPPIV